MFTAERSFNVNFMLDFNNTEIAYSAKSLSELKGIYALFRLIKYPFVVKLTKYAGNLARVIHFPLRWIVGNNICKQFMGGEKLTDCVETICKLSFFNIKSTLEYSVEKKQTPPAIEASFREIHNCIDYAKKNENLVFVVFRSSSITTDELLSKVSEKRSKLSIEEIKAFREFKERFMDICQHAYDNDVRILVEAEDYCFQDAVDSLTDEAMKNFNTKHAIVYATLQMYRYDRMSYLRRIYDDALDNNYIPGIKIVRGSFMEAERLRAATLGYPDPICIDKQATDENFAAGIQFVVDHIDRFELFMGSHNEDSNYMLVSLMKEKGLSVDDSRIYFAQLYGMSDTISFNLAKAGYNVTKYVPYAPVNELLAYLIRRAEDNTAIVKQINHELDLLNLEIERRTRKINKALLH